MSMELLQQNQWQSLILVSTRNISMAVLNGELSAWLSISLFVIRVT